MLNQIVIVGRLNDKVTLEKAGRDKGTALISVSVPRVVQNKKKEYNTDIIPVFLSKAIATKAHKYCEQGDLLGVKGRLQVDEDGTVIFAEKVTFLSTKDAGEEE